MKRWLLIGGGAVGVLVVIVVGVVVFVLASLNDIIKAAVEQVGTELTQAQVTLEEADVSITEGTGALHGLVVGTPAGYKTPSALELGVVSVALGVTP